MGAALELSGTGRIDRPADIRKAAGLERGGAIREVMASLQAEALEIFRDTGETVEALIAERRHDASRDMTSP